MLSSSSIKIETPRLYLHPLSYEQLQQYLRLDFSLEDGLGLERYERIIAPALMEAFHESILPAAAKAKDDLLYVTLWTIIVKEKKRMVGDMCFKGGPNEAGEIEIGYGTYPDFCCNGFMTEAVSAIIKWAFQQPGVNYIVAETDDDNFASQKILLRNNFMQQKQIDKMLRWRLDNLSTKP
ncbi:GNAT family N-acetyltransferase [soil metagenome]